MDFSHLPVMADECLRGLDIQPQGIYMDGTAGGAGHSCLIAQQLTTGHLYALDQDPDAVAVATQRLAGLPATVVHTNFRNAPEALGALGVHELDGALLDLGVSSYQLDNPARGFTYREDAPLDMRMSQSGPTAAELVNTLDRQQLADILRKYGEEAYAWNIAGHIVAERQVQPLETTGQLAALVAASVPPAVRRKDKNPARKTFQALRIAVNGELDALTQGLEGVFGLLKPGGRFAILTFHSLEDRIVKHQFRQWATACTCPPQFPVCVCGGKAKAKLVGKNPLVPSPQELEQNRRSRSAKLRVCEKL